MPSRQYWPINDMKNKEFCPSYNRKGVPNKMACECTYYFQTCTCIFLKAGRPSFLAQACHLSKTTTTEALVKTDWRHAQDGLKPPSSNYLNPRGVGIRAVIEPDGVPHLVSQQGPSLLRHTVSHLSANKNKAWNLKQASVLHCEPNSPAAGWHWQKVRGHKLSSYRDSGHTSRLRHSNHFPLCCPASLQQVLIEGRWKRENKAWITDSA